MEKLQFFACYEDLKRTFASEVGTGERILVAVEAPASKVNVSASMIDDAKKLIAKSPSKKVRMYVTAGQTVSTRSV